jgi:serine/threonine-protein kinase
MMAHQFKQPTPLAELCPDAPAVLVAVVERLMQKAPEARYAGVDEVVDALQPLAAVAQPLGRARPARASRLSDPPRRAAESAGARPAPRLSDPPRPAPNGRPGSTPPVPSRLAPPPSSRPVPPESSRPGSTPGAPGLPPMPTRRSLGTTTPQDVNATPVPEPAPAVPPTLAVDDARKGMSPIVVMIGGLLIGAATALIAMRFLM